jgi:FimV C-terminal domain
MSNEQLKHIFDNSACLTKKQMIDYVAGTMINEESHAVEVHLNSCPFCNEAIEGMFEQQEGNTADVLAGINSDFLKDHFSLQNPQIHLNSLAPAAQATGIHYQPKKKKAKTQPLFRTVSIAAALLLLFFTLWYFDFGKSKPTQQLAHNTDVSATQPSQQPPVAQSQIEDLPAVNKTVTTSNNIPTPPNTNGTPQSPQALVTTNLANDDEAIARKNEIADAAAQKEEVVVNAYKAPLVDKYNPEQAKRLSAEQVEKMPTRSTESVAATAPATYNKKEGELTIAGARPGTTTYIVDGVQVKDKATADAPKKLEKPSESASNISKAGTQYSNGQYNAALTTLKADLGSSEASRRNPATLLAAKCYIALGNKEKARKLLQPLADEASGSDKRQAKRMLKDLGEE